jgi:ketosteroid isomerase-like protein
MKDNVKVGLFAGLTVLVVSAACAIADPSTEANVHATSATISAVKETISGAVAQINADNALALGQYFASNAIVIDAAAPYQWSGANAAQRWWQDVDSGMARAHIAGTQVKLGTVSTMQISGDNAYVVVPMVISYTVQGKPATSNGLWTLTLQRSGTDWKIVTASHAVEP